jgi:peptidoglycan/LPS O-acetylase OafA/YrhL
MIKEGAAMETERRIASERRLRLRLRQQVDWGRLGLLVILAVTLLNQILLLFRVNYHFLFSAAVPYYLNWLARELSANSDVGVFGFFASVLTLLLYGAYAACWFQSGRRKEWLMAALGLYGLDTLLLIIFCLTLLENPASCLLEILTHCVGIALLVVAVRAAEQLSRLPKQRRVPGQRSMAQE